MYPHMYIWYIISESDLSIFSIFADVSPGGEIRDEPIDISKVADPENMDIVDKPLWLARGSELGR